MHHFGHESKLAPRFNHHKKKKKYVRFSKLSCFGQRARATDQIKNLLSILAFRQIRTLLAQELHS